MLKNFNERKRLKATARQIYGSIVTQARSPLFYAVWKVPDSIEGRFEMVVMHLVLVMRRLKGAGAKPQDLSRLIAEAFVDDMDDSLREMGVSDLKVPKHMRKAGDAFHGRLRAYSEALDGEDMTGLRASLMRNIVMAREGEGPDVDALADYMVRSGNRLAELPEDDLLAGMVAFGEFTGGGR